jgi:sugar lactone lactonase YvrE
VASSTAVEFTAELEGGLEGLLGGLDLPDCLVGNQYTPEPVPTDVQVGKQGMLYVSTLQGGAGELVPLSKVYRVDPGTGTATEVAGGMHGTTGLALAKSGHIFVAEMFGGEVSVIQPGSTTATTVFAADSPSDVDLKGSTVYATTGVFGNGALVKYLYPLGR